MTSNGPRGRRIMGSLRSAEGQGIVRMEDRFATNIDDLWSAITDPTRLALWLGDIQGDLRLGGEFRAHFFDGWEGTGRVEACESPRHLLVLTRDEPDKPYGHPIESTLTAGGDQTVLIWEEQGIRLEQLAAYGAGIQVHVEDLADYIAGRRRVDTNARWEALMPAYQRLAAEAC